MPGRSQAIRHCPKSGSIRARASTDFIEPDSIRGHAMPASPGKPSGCRKRPTTIVAADNDFASRAMDMGTGSFCQRAWSRIATCGTSGSLCTATAIFTILWAAPETASRSGPMTRPGPGRHTRSDDMPHERHLAAHLSPTAGGHPDDNQTKNTLTIFCPSNPSEGRIPAGNPCQSDRQFVHGHS